MPLSGNQSAGTGNIKGFKDGASVEKGKDPMPRGTGHISTTPMKMNLKDFSKTETTACGVEY